MTRKYQFTFSFARIKILYKSLYLKKTVIGPVNFVHVCFQSVPVNLLT